MNMALCEARGKLFFDENLTETLVCVPVPWLCIICWLVAPFAIPLTGKWQHARAWLCRPTS